MTKPETDPATAPMEPRDIPPQAAGRAALILARVALQALVDLGPETASAVDDALIHEVRALGGKDNAASRGARALIEDLRRRLADTSDHLMGEEAVWFID
jgi:hypothetical protein